MVYMHVAYTAISVLFGNDARWRKSHEKFCRHVLPGSYMSGADPGFFLGGDALVSCSSSTPINHIVFFLQNTSCIRKPQVISGGGGGGCTPPAPSP